MGVGRHFAGASRAILYLFDHQFEFWYGRCHDKFAIYNHGHADGYLFWRNQRINGSQLYQSW